jgi:dTDP-4-dehydrorhamnose 3,5-epimerase
MTFSETPLRGAFVIDIESQPDERGFFARTWCAREFEAHGLETRFVQASLSFNRQPATLRGLHYQVAPHEEAKLIRCTTGAIFDVLVDLRPDSPTYTHHFSVVLSSANRRLLYVPRGLAHGFQTLEPNVEVEYQMSGFHHPECARGVRWNDPAFGIDWPLAERRIMLARDRSYPDFHRPIAGIAR